MAISFIIQKKRITVGATPGIKFIARIFRERSISQLKIAKEIASSSSLSVGDVLSVIRSLQEKMAEHLSEGQGIDLELLGIFKPAIRATAMNTMEEVKSSTVGKICIDFLPTKELKEIIANAGVLYIDTNITGVQYRNATPETEAEETEEV
jgi:predicted histone-like DNA-binding protein